VVGVPGCVVTRLGAKDQTRARRLAFGWEVSGGGAWGARDQMRCVAAVRVAPLDMREGDRAGLHAVRMATSAG
jgi:hypothetical protein